MRSAEARGVEVVKAVLARNLHAKCRLCNQYVTFKLPLDTREDSTSNKSDYRLWGVKRENLLIEPGEYDAIAPQGHAYEKTGVEVVSRILSSVKDLHIPGLNELKGCHMISWEQEIAAVLRELRREFRTFEEGKPKYHYLYPNLSSSVHVHVGMAGHNYALDHVKKTMAMYLASERLIDRIHARQRIVWTAVGTKSLSEHAISLGNHGRTHLDTDFMVDRGLNASLADAFLLSAYRRRQIEEGCIDYDAFSILKYNGYPIAQSASDWDLWKCAREMNLDRWIMLIRRAEDMLQLQQLWWYTLKSSSVSIVRIPNNKPLEDNSSIMKTIEFRQHAGTMETAPVLRWVDFVTKRKKTYVPSMLCKH
jgi:hypothetical protein